MAQTQKAQKVIEHLSKLDEAHLLDEAIQFFKSIVLYPIFEDKYACALLDFFHSRGMLLHKQTVRNEQKQQVKRYLVIYTMRSPIQLHVFSKMYNSIREIKNDTGKKPSEIRCLPTSELCFVNC